jgi:predicted anti-sigma-YlaC factor YlaD
MAIQRSQAVVPGRYIPLARITGAEILSDRHPVSLQVAKTTIHGRAPQIFAVGVRMIRAAVRADPRLAAGLASVLPELSAGEAVQCETAEMSPEGTESRLYPVTPAEGSGEEILPHVSPKHAVSGLPVMTASAA